MRKFFLYLALAIAATLPGFYLRLTGTHAVPVLEAAIFFVAILGAGFLLSWGAEAAEEHVSGVVFEQLIAVLADPIPSLPRAQDAPAAFNVPTDRVASGRGKQSSLEPCFDACCRWLTAKC